MKSKSSTGVPMQVFDTGTDADVGKTVFASCYLA
jgi:dethiobiotin synthetase